MKKILYAFLLVFSVSLFAQNMPVNDKTGKITYDNQYTSEGMTVNQLEKIVNEFLTSKEFQKKEEEKGKKVTYSGSVDVSYPAVKAGENQDGKINFEITAMFKEGKYRIIITECIHEGKGKDPSGGALELERAECGTRMSAKGWVTVKNKANILLPELATELETKIEEIRNDPTNEDDW